MAQLNALNFPKVIAITKHVEANREAFSNIGAKQCAEKLSSELGFPVSESSIKDIFDTIGVYFRVVPKSRPTTTDQLLERIEALEILVKNILSGKAPIQGGLI